MSVADRGPMRRLLPLVLLVAACAEPRTNLTDHLMECGFLTPGDRVDVALRDVYLPTDCYEDCFARAACVSIEATLCRTSFDLAFACDQECAFRCGDDTIVGTERRCNAVNDCADGRDEEGCTNLVRCTDGSMRTGVRCNGSQDCYDNSDELGCPGTTCNGSPLPAYLRCNGHVDCEEGSDERDCPTYGCDDGTTFAPRSDPRCDGYPQCADGSDEAGCARLTLMCSP